MWPYRTSLILAIIWSGVLTGLAQTEVCLTNHPSDDRYASYSPDGRLILFETNRDGNWEIYTMLPDGNGQRRLTDQGADDRSPTWHPDGKHILFESNRSGRNLLYTIHIKTGRIKQITGKNEAEGEWIFGSFSPSGKRIAASYKESEEKSNIRILNRKGRTLHAVTNSNARSYYPRWSNDGMTLVYFSRKETNNQVDEIFIYRPDTQAEVKLNNTKNNTFCPSWSPDGRQIAYVASMDETKPEIFLMQNDGSATKRITNNEDGDTLPSWSPEGDHLLITAFRNGNFEICKLSLSQ